MKILRNTALVVALLAAALGGLYIAMAERVEVVVVHTSDAVGDHTTRLWIVDDAGRGWLRTGADNATWLPRLRANPAIEIERDGAKQTYTAVVLDDEATLARIDELSLLKYGWSESLLRAMGGSNQGHVAIRLDPR